MVYFFLIFLSAVTDLYVKSRVKKSLGTGTKDISDILQLSVVKNPGVAYGLLRTKPNAVRLLSGSGILLLTFNLIKSLSSAAPKTADNFALSLVIGGALGNFIDRMQNGSVTDFIRLKWKKAPVFNIADVCILIGAVVLLVSDLFRKQK